MILTGNPTTVENAVREYFSMLFRNSKYCRIVVPRTTLNNIETNLSKAAYNSYKIYNIKKAFYKAYFFPKVSLFLQKCILAVYCCISHALWSFLMIFSDSRISLCRGKQKSTCVLPKKYQTGKYSIIVQCILCIGLKKPPPTRFDRWIKNLPNVFIFLSICSFLMRWKNNFCC